jgi:transposase
MCGQGLSVGRQSATNRRSGHQRFHPPFKSSNTKAKYPGAWNKAFHFFNLHREEFLERYHARSNAETTFSAIKRKFGDSVKAKNDLAMKNEVLAKIVCHNLSCLIHAMEEFGIDPEFRRPLA